uniref:Uncharacterized protein n=1 Tax=Panagrolaimus sp. ES5 TaxID=591445 RepID=A0AC34GJ61_9BILA
MKLMENGSAIVNAMIKKDGKKVPLLVRFYFVTNGITKTFGRIIPAHVVSMIHQQNGRLEIVAEFIEPLDARAIVGSNRNV